MVKLNLLEKVLEAKRWGARIVCSSNEQLKEVNKIIDTSKIKMLDPILKSKSKS
jgi:hypothetical protein